MAKQELQQGRNWFVIHTYAGYEEAVAKSLLQRVENLGMQDKIFNVLVPHEKKVKIKNGKRKVVEEKIYPGYVLVEMMVTDDSWYVVRNTPNVTGFVGSSTTPIPVSPQEIEILKKRMGGENPEFNIDFELNEKVKIVDGIFKDYDGKICEIDKEHGKIKVLVNMFGRDTPVELDTLQVKKL
jgi:transcriptional antiterminator NusG